MHPSLSPPIAAGQAGVTPGSPGHPPVPFVLQAEGRSGFQGLPRGQGASELPQLLLPSGLTCVDLGSGWKNLGPGIASKNEWLPCPGLPGPWGVTESFDEGQTQARCHPGAPCFSLTPAPAPCCSSATSSGDSSLRLLSPARVRCSRPPRRPQSSLSLCPVALPPQQPWPRTVPVSQTVRGSPASGLRLSRPRGCHTGL